MDRTNVIPYAHVAQSYLSQQCGSRFEYLSILLGIDAVFHKHTAKAQNKLIIFSLEMKFN